MFKIETRPTEEQRVATIEERHRADDLPDFISRAMGKLYDTIGAANLDTGTPFVVYHGEVNTDADGPIEVCVPFSGSLDPLDDVRIRIEPAGVEHSRRSHTRSRVSRDSRGVRRGIGLGQGKQEDIRRIPARVLLCRLGFSP